MGPALQLTDITLTLDGTTVLDGIDWTVRTGERWVVLGPNGAGKTTLLRVAALYQHPTHGAVDVLGNRLGRCDVRTLRERIAFSSPALAAQVYVCRPPDETPTGKYLGTVHFQRLLRDPPFTLVSAVIDSDLPPLGPDTPLPAVTSYLAAYNMVAAPVVDETGSLLGAVTVDDVLDHMLPEDWRESDDDPDVEHRPEDPRATASGRARTEAGRG